MFYLWTWARFKYTHDVYAKSDNDITDIGSEKISCMTKIEKQQKIEFQSEDHGAYIWIIIEDKLSILYTLSSSKITVKYYLSAAIVYFMSIPAIDMASGQSPPHRSNEDNVSPDLG